MRPWLGRVWSARTAALPRREGWVALAVSSSGYPMCACVVATAIAKGDNVFELGVERPGLVLAWAILSDLWMFLGLAGVFALVEARWRNAVWVTVPLAFMVAAYVALNTAYLVLAGEQGSWHAIVTLAKQYGDVEMVLEDAASPSGIVSVIGTMLVLAAVPVGVRRLGTARGRGEELDADERARRSRRAAWLRAGAALPTALVAGIAMVALPGPQAVDASILGHNSVVKFVRTAVQVWDSGNFEGYSPTRLVDDDELARFSARADRPNIVFVVLESTRYDHTALSGHGARAQTPRLGALAARGLVAHRARAVVPHTTKSLFTLLCARYPTMQRGVIEVAGNDRVQCLPELLRVSGYRTGFFQSAFGTFEQRPRLVENLGFEHFDSWESIQGRKLGYLASDDGSLVAPFRTWMSEHAHEPFFALLLTSATHHSYRMTPTLRRKAQKANLPRANPEDRYARLVEAEDEMLGEVLDAIDEEGLRERTLVVVVGDHGEGFGAHGVKQHDNNFYEEGLHVPLVIVGPGVPRAQRHDNVSLLDLTPTLMGRLGLRLADEVAPTVPGHDLLAEDHPGNGTPRYFTCYSTWKCRGFVVGDHKVVYVPEDDELWYFDLAADPEEQFPLVLTGELRRWVDPMHELVEAHTTRHFEPEYEHLDKYGRWVCPEDEGICLHPRAFKPEYRPDARGAAPADAEAEDEDAGSAE